MANPLRRPAAVLLLLASPFLFAFDSYKYPFEKVRADPVLQAEIRKALTNGEYGKVYAEHYEISLECLKTAGVRPELAEAMAQRASDIDLDDWKNKRDYEAKNHCDRSMTESDEGAFTAALHYHRERVAEAWNSWSSGKPPDVQNVAKILPCALHDEEDFFSHSNWADLSEGTQKQLIACWTMYGAHPGVSHDENYALIEKDARCTVADFRWNIAPSLLRITGFDPKALDNYAPPGDSYSHRRYAKDNPGYSNCCRAGSLMLA